MRKYWLLTLFITLIALSACSSTETYTYWTEESEEQIQRLNEADIRYEVRDGEIWVSEKDMDEVVACCS
ncbi:hypothetical protein N780_04040 [Pontibacillus chungwhensis BH030062]|uniref:Lipoprotein n=1 Tax=Pontibacillus chungwhensis BH030062 TaxID=1385513 RepID=A0A0A2VAC3_9BACI|nr:hypothetical protein [Pontibacillus chungwhensis]KGP90655.1 hypothetical protein N780_04040 [Pontibacillus chungwhensis BH030062]